MGKTVCNCVHYATESSIYKSINAGDSFTPLTPNPGWSGSDNITITDIDVTLIDNNNIVVVGTRDKDESQYGGVYILDENKPLSGWTNTDIGDYDICTVVFSPNFATDRQLVAVVTDEKDTLITIRIGDTDWGTDIGDATIKGLIPISATIAFPDDHDATTTDYILFVAIDSGNDKGDVYRISANQAPGNSTATDLDIGDMYNLKNVDVSGLAINGNTLTAILLVGAANSNQVYISTDSGKYWTRSTKQPTGQLKTSVLMATDFDSSGIAYVATTGTESAFSYTKDGGITWNQIGLIDTTITTIVDLAPSPDYSQDNALFMLTHGGETSLWRSLNGGIRWERVLTTTPDNIDRIELVKLPPSYGNDSQVLFLAGISNGNPAIWKSTDNGQNFKVNKVIFPVDTWAIVDNDTLFFGSYDGSNGLVYHTTDSGISYSNGTEAGSEPLNSIVVSPSYEQDETILIGNTNGWIYWSNNNGSTFESLPLDATSAPLTGCITVAFDPEFSSNRVVYAVSDTNATIGSSERIYRFIIGKSDTWESIDSTVPISSMFNQIAVSDDGTLYVTNSQPVDTKKKEGSIERSLNPTYSLGPTFETVTRGLYDGTTLTGLWLRGNQLWSIDATNIKLMTYIDSLTYAVTLTSPPDKASGTDTRTISLDWQTLEGATGYEWQLDYDGNFSTVPSEFQGNTQASSVRLPELEMATTYYWRVRVNKPVLSPWSDKWSFTTSLGTEIIAPELYSPKAGVSEVPIKPVFQWSAIAGADSYELMVSTDAAFKSPIIARTGVFALPATAWQSDVSLGYNTTYYWKVRASSAMSHSAWSAVGAFITESPPPESPPPIEITSPSGQVASSPPTPPQPSPSTTEQDLPDLVLYLVGSLLIVIVLLLITLLVMVIRTSRP